jgi:tetrapyrrole methylase family protein/MazG family protein
MAVDRIGITLMGLGPGNPNLLTREAWELLQVSTEIYLRTTQHPTVSAFPTSLLVHSFDHIYNSADSFDTVYEHIITTILDLGNQPTGVIYAVPGHPFVAEATAPEIFRRARQAGLPVRVIEGLSFLESAFTALALDPFSGLSLVDALDVARTHIPNFPPEKDALIAQMYSRSVASDVKLTLMEIYPDDHPVRLIHAAGMPNQEIEDLDLHQIDQSEKIGLLSTLYVPALGPATSFEAFQEVIAHLRAPDGCPWDREQTHRSLRPYLLEEAYEVLSALDSEDPQALKEELGDLLLQILLHAQIAAENGDFNMAQVLQFVNQKIVFRHPHVFGDLKVTGVDGVLVNWERLKSEERAKNGKSSQSILDGIPQALPALVQAEQYQRRAARTGFKWPEVEDVTRKIQEELGEVIQAATPEARAAEIGDLLFAVVNLAYWYGCDPESSLREANLRYRQRFAFIESQARQIGKSLSELSLDQMLSFWQAAKESDLHNG